MYKDLMLQRLMNLVRVWWLERNRAILEDQLHHVQMGIVRNTFELSEAHQKAGVFEMEEVLWSSN